MFQKSFRAFEVKATDKPGELACIASVTGNVDLGNDVIVPGAFQGFISRVKAGQAHFPALCYGHRADDLGHLLGKVTDMEELLPGDPRLPESLRAGGFGGLLVKARYNLKTQAGQDGYEHALAGDVAEFSFMFDVPEKGFDAQGHRLLKVIDPVIEVSHVLMGMNPLTATVSLKATTLQETMKADRIAAAELISESFIQRSIASLSEDDAAEVKDWNGNIELPVLEGDEAAHNEALSAALGAISALIAQELAEDDMEFGCISRLACIAQCLLDWAQGEAMESEASAPSMMAADELETKDAEPLVAVDAAAPAIPDWMLYGLSLSTEQAV